MRKIALLALYFTLPVFAVDCPDDIDSILDYVLKHNKILLAKRALLNSVSTLNEQAYSGFRPHIGIGGSIATEHRNYNSAFGGKTDNVNPVSVGISASINLYNGGKTTSDIQIAKHKVSAEKYALESAEQEIGLKAVKVYLMYLNAISILNLKKSNKKVMLNYYSECKHKVSLGRGTNTDLYQAKARLDLAESQCIQADTSVKEAAEYFFSVVGKVPCNLLSIDLSKITKRLPETLKETEKIAVCDNPKIKQLVCTKSVLEESVKNAKSGLYPTVDLKLAALYQRKQVMLDKMNKRQVEMSINIPIYDGNLSNSRSEEFHYQVVKIVCDIEQAKIDIVKSTRCAWNNIEKYKSEIICIKSQIKANQMALEGVKAESINGSRTTLDVLNAEQELLDSKVHLSHSEHNLIEAYFELLYLINRILLSAKDQLLKY